jgi:hypothetical protein
MKGLSILFTVSLFVFAGILGHVLKRAGVLPHQISARENPVPIRLPMNFADYNSNNPHHLN